MNKEILIQISYCDLKFRRSHKCLKYLYVRSYE